MYRKGHHNIENRRTRERRGNHRLLPPANCSPCRTWDSGRAQSSPASSSTTSASMHSVYVTNVDTTVHEFRQAICPQKPVCHGAGVKARKELPIGRPPAPTAGRCRRTGRGSPVGHLRRAFDCFVQPVSSLGVECTFVHHDDDHTMYRHSAQH